MPDPANPNVTQSIAEQARRLQAMFGCALIPMTASDSLRNEVDGLREEVRALQKAVTELREERSGLVLRPTAAEVKRFGGRHNG
jgi:uncharacterized coiled-coil DUF342 family protein